LQAQNIGAGSVEGEKNGDVGAEVLLELSYGGTRIKIIAISDDMALIGAGYCLNNFGVNAGIVVAGEVARGLSERSRHIA
jgi:hypothetical protein